MTILREPGLGPLIGHTTPTTCRVWMRAEDPGDNKVDLDEDRRTIGVIGLVGDEVVDGVRKKVVGPAYYFRLTREYDRTGVFELGFNVDLGRYQSDVANQPDDIEADQPEPLIPDTEYTVCCGSLTIDDPFPNDINLSDFVLRKYLPPIEQIKGELLRLDPKKARATFRTPPDVQDAGALSFLLGSCRYPGLLWKIKEADRIFGPMADQLERRPGASPAAFTLMVGDQIYADELNRAIPILRADTYEEFQQRYMTAFGGPNMRRLLAMAPTYMILDDHEIEDNWSQDRVEKKRALFTTAISAYMNYQWCHSARTFKKQFLYYSFDWTGFPFFVLDARTQRYKDDKDIRKNHLLGLPSHDSSLYPSQLDHLLDWLVAQQRKGNQPKFIVTSSVFVPNAMDERNDPDADEDDLIESLLESDSWPAFPNTRQRLLKLIVDHKIQNVVFLSGDIHCSNVARISFSGAAGVDQLRAFSITSSAFYWPFQFADGDPNGFVHNSKAEEQRDTFDIDGVNEMDYRAWGFTQEDNFCRVDVSRANHTITVRPYSNKGEKLMIADADGAKREQTVLDLAPW
jgi:alkaline phosphatase D